MQNPITEAIYGVMESSRAESERIYGERLGKMETNVKQVGKERDEGAPCTNHRKVCRLQLIYLTSIAFVQCNRSNMGYD